MDLGNLGENEYAPRLVGDVIYVHYTKLHQWAENREARILHDKDWQRLLKSIQKYGVKDKLQVGDDGTVYDGNHRLEGVIHLIGKGILTAANGKDLAWLPVAVSTPQTDAEILALVLSGNDNTFAIYNKEWIMNNQARIEQVEDFSDISIEAEEPLTLGEAFDWPEDDDEDDTEEDDSEDNESDDGEPANPNKLPKSTNLVTKEVTCPQCSHTFKFNP